MRRRTLAGALASSSLWPLSSTSPRSHSPNSGRLFQSSANFAIPASVSGWPSICLKTLYGIVETSQPSRAAVTTCTGCRIDAASTCASRSGPSASTISATTSSDVTEMSSRRPMKQDTYVAPASTVSSACAAENTSVSLTGMPSEASSRVAARPSAENGTFTTTRSSSAASARPSATISRALSETTSAEVGPSTSSQMRRMLSPGSPSSLARSDGLVVAPESTPQPAISSTSATDPVSMNSFIGPPGRHRARAA